VGSVAAQGIDLWHMSPVDHLVRRCLGSGLLPDLRRMAKRSVQRSQLRDLHQAA